MTFPGSPLHTANRERNADVLTANAFGRSGSLPPCDGVVFLYKPILLLNVDAPSLWYGIDATPRLACFSYCPRRSATFHHLGQKRPVHLLSPSFKHCRCRTSWGCLRLICNRFLFLPHALVLRLNVGGCTTGPKVQVFATDALCFLRPHGLTSTSWESDARGA